MSIPLSISGRDRVGSALCGFENRPAPRGGWGLALLVLLLSATAVPAADPLHIGPLFDEFDLTFQPGHRLEAGGPLFYDQQRGSEHTFAVPPFFSDTRDPEIGLHEFDFFYPIFSLDRYGTQRRWQFLQVLSLSGGPTQVDSTRSRFTLFPFYFQQRSTNPSENYTAVFPFYGHLDNRMFRDETFFAMFPLYSKTRKKDVITRNYLVPIVHYRTGEGLSGWQIWPLAGYEHKDITFRTNMWKEPEQVPGHDKRFVLWPLFFNEHTGLGTDNPVWQQTSLPAYSILRSPKRDSTTVLWPLFSYIDDREKDFREWELPWLLVEFASGTGKTTRRVFPFYSHSQSSNYVSDFVLWPVYKYNRANLDSLDRERTRSFFYLFSNITDRNKATGEMRRRLDVWPLFSYRRDFNGDTRFQALALIEAVLPGSHKIERDYSHIWSLWRAEKNPRRDASSQSLLWNLYRRDVTPEHKRVSLLFGLYQHEKSAQGKARTRLFFIPF